MTDLARYTLFLAGGLLLLGLPLSIAPQAVARRYRKLPRNIWAGRLLSAPALAWSGWLLYRMPFEFLQPYRGLIPWLIPVVILLTWLLMDEWLAARALGGLAVLIPTPLLAAVRAHPSDWRLSVTLSAYALVIAGMILLLSPYRLRNALDRTLNTPVQARLWGLAATVYGLGLGVLAIWVFD